MTTSPAGPQLGQRLTRRDFVQLLAAAVPLWRVAVIAPPAPIFLAQGPRGIWGITAQPAAGAAAAFSRGPRGLLGLERGSGNGLALTRGPGGWIGVGTNTAQ